MEIQKYKLSVEQIELVYELMIFNFAIQCIF